jgi:hypothetical protein
MLIYFHYLHRHARYFAAGDDSLRSDTPNWRMIYEPIWDLGEDMRQKNQYGLIYSAIRKRTWKYPFKRLRLVGFHVNFRMTIYSSSRNWRVYASGVANLW